MLFNKLQPLKDLMGKFPQLFDVISDTNDDFDVVCNDGCFLVIVNSPDGNTILKGKRLSVYHIFDDVKKYGNHCGLDLDNQYTSNTNIDIGFKLPNYLVD